VFFRSRTATTTVHRARAVALLLELFVVDLALQQRKSNKLNLGARKELKAWARTFFFRRHTWYFSSGDGDKGFTSLKEFIFFGLKGLKGFLFFLASRTRVRPAAFFAFSPLRRSFISAAV
jgi:hypothetical protein